MGWWLMWRWRSAHRSTMKPCSLSMVSLKATVLGCMLAAITLALPTTKAHTPPDTSIDTIATYGYHMVSVAVRVMWGVMQDDVREESSMLQLPLAPSHLLPLCPLQHHHCQPISQLAHYPISQPASQPTSKQSINPRHTANRPSELCGGSAGQ